MLSVRLFFMASLMMSSAVLAESGSLSASEETTSIPVYSHDPALNGMLRMVAKKPGVILQGDGTVQMHEGCSAWVPAWSGMMAALGGFLTASSVGHGRIGESNFFIVGVKNPFGMGVFAVGALMFGYITCHLFKRYKNPPVTIIQKDGLLKKSFSNDIGTFYPWDQVKEHPYRGLILGDGKKHAYYVDPMFNPISEEQSFLLIERFKFLAAKAAKMGGV